MTVKGLEQYSTEVAISFATLLDELEHWNRKINLTAIRDRDEMIAGHLRDSLSVRSFLQGDRILDVGTGAGFPGLPLAIVEPAREFHLIDGNNKKIQFVRHVAGLLGLDNVTAVKARSEDYAPGYRFDTVVARAVAPTAQLLDMAGHHVREDGVLIALKGRLSADELEGLPTAWSRRVEALEVPGYKAGARHAVLLSRE